jgi:two-component system response regulator CpxR
VHILLVDDDTELAALLSEFLGREGFTVSCEHDGLRGLDHARRPGNDLVVLDVMLPDLDGFEILRRLRTDSKVPVIMLTARGEDVDRIVGLDLGADDYLAKPFNPKELVARIRSVLRRYEARPAASVSGRVEVAGITLDPASRTVIAHGKAVELTTFEFDILELLMRSAGTVLSRDALMENFYNRKATPFDRSIDMHISHLRKKLENGESLIKTIRGVGYQLCRTPEDVRTE